MVKEVRPITFVRDLRDGFNKRFDVQVEKDEALERAKARHPHFGPDDEGEALEPVEPEAIVADAIDDDPIDDDPVADDGLARRRRPARD